MSDEILVEVAYATPQKQLIVELQVADGTTALEAVRQSGITDEFPAINLKKDAMGIFSNLLNGKDYPMPDEYVLQARDRVEIYRPLLIEPKQARSDRAQKKAAVKKKVTKKAAKKVDKIATEKVSKKATKKVDKKVSKKVKKEPIEKATNKPGTLTDSGNTD